MADTAAAAATPAQPEAQECHAGSSSSGTRMQSPAAGGGAPAAECNICLLTAAEQGEALVVPCACVTMPVHPSCLEAWRMRCKNPASALRCPSCRERYRTPLTPRTAPPGSAPLVWAARLAGDGRLGVYLRRRAHGAGGRRRWPPEVADLADIRTSAVLASFCAGWWLLSWLFCELVGYHLRGQPAIAAGIHATFKLWRGVSVLCFCTSMVGAVGIHWVCWLGLRVYVWGLTAQVALCVLAMVSQLPAEEVAVCAYLVAGVALLQALCTIWLTVPVYNFMNPSVEALAAPVGESYCKRVSGRVRIRREAESSVVVGSLRDGEPTGPITCWVNMETKFGWSLRLPDGRGWVHTHNARGVQLLERVRGSGPDGGTTGARPDGARLRVPSSSDISVAVAATTVRQRGTAAGPGTVATAHEPSIYDHPGY
jgi:hypothetical protein